MASANVRVDVISGPLPGDVEIVERKGIGHPDTICDALAERLSCSLSAFYLARFGVILHHNVDKALLVGGAAVPEFGGGRVIEPIEIHLAGRAVTRAGDVDVPVQALAIEGAREWLRANLVALDVDRDVRIVVHIRPGSVDLGELFRRGGSDTVLSNDTSYGVGFAPLSSLEHLVLEVERELNSEDFRARHPAGGEDVKVMGTRDGAAAALTVARAFIGRHLVDLDAYFAAKEQLRRAVAELARRRFSEVDVVVNASDGRRPGSVYLTVTGTSAEAGDDGEVGRGNRVNGLITPYRPMSLEAAAGKNAVSHVGKLYNLVALEAANAIARELSADVRHAEVFLQSRIGHPVVKPYLSHVRLVLVEPGRLEGLRPQVVDLVSSQLASIEQLWRRVVHGELAVY